MKVNTLLLLLVFCSSALFAQVDERLSNAYSKDEIANMDEQKVAFMTYCLDNAWYITPLPKEKVKNDPSLVKPISISDLDNLNFWKLGIELMEKDYQYFHVEGTEKLLVVKSILHIKRDWGNNE